MKSIDRLAPARRPAGTNDGTQLWRDLLFCHWEIPMVALRKRVPPALKIDTFDGRAYVGVVPFRMREIRPNWLPRRLAFNFFETNVRTYVLHKNRPGVFFFSLDASSRLAVWAARFGWSLPYFHAAMSGSKRDGQFLYDSHRPREKGEHQVAFKIGAERGASSPGTLEHFLFERYLLFVEHRKQIYAGQVHHQPYQVFDADVETIRDGLIRAAGLPDFNRVPELAHYSPGVDVEVFGIKPD